MSIRINKNKFLEWLYIFCAISAVGLLKPVGSIFALDTVIKFVIIIFSLFSILIAYRKSKIKKHKNISLGIVTYLLLITIITVLHSRYDLYSNLWLSLNYIYILWTLPLEKIYDNSFSNIESLLKKIVIINLLSYLLRYAISFTYLITGARILNSISMENAASSNWVRNGILRINPPCYSTIFIPICLYFYWKYNKRSKKVFYLLCIAISLVYSGLIHGSRAAIMCQVLTLILMVFVKRRKGVGKKAFIFILLFIGVFIFLNSPYFDNLIQSLIPSSSGMGWSTYARLYAFDYFWRFLKKSPIFGTGFLRYRDLSAFNQGTVTGSLEDLGFMFSLVQCGLIIIPFYVYFFFAGFSSWWKLRKNNSNSSILNFGLAISMLLSGFTIDMFYDIYAFSIPLCLSIFIFFRNSSLSRRI